MQGEPRGGWLALIRARRQTEKVVGLKRNGLCERRSLFRTRNRRGAVFALMAAAIDEANCEVGPSSADNLC